MLYSSFAGLASLLMCYLSVIAHTNVNIQHWDTRFPLLVGNELSGNRPWMGSIKGLAVYDRALALDDAAILSKLSFDREYASERVILGAEVVYDFTAEPLDQAIRQILPGDPPLDLLLPLDEQAWSYGEGALDILQPTLIRTKSVSKRLAKLPVKANELSVELLVKAASLHQVGPARIVSMSRGISLANFMVGQRESRIEFRVRTPRTGTNGGRRICRSTKLNFTRDWHHVVATYKDGVQRLYVDGQSARRPLHLYAMSQVVLGADWFGASVLTALICFVPIGFAIGAGVWGRAKSIIAMFFQFVIAVAPLISLICSANSYEHEQDVVFIVASILSVIVGFALANFLRCMYSVDDEMTGIGHG